MPDAYDLTPRAPVRPLIWPEVAHRVQEAVAEPEAVYLVGGCVRDALLGSAQFGLRDLDLVTAGKGLKLARRIADALGGAYYPLDAERDVGRAIVEEDGGRLEIDVSGFRGEDLLADLQARDFTVNAIAASLAQPDLLVDPLDGENDLLRAKALRLCHPTSIESDPIRALRAIRFALKFGLRMDKPALAAVRAGGAALVGEDGALNQPERVRDELFKLLGGDAPHSAVRLMNSLGLLALMPHLRGDRLPALEQFAYLRGIISPRRTDNSAAQLTLGMAVMILDRHRAQLQEHLDFAFSDGRSLPALLALHLLAEPGTEDAVAEALKLSNEERARLRAMPEAVARFAQVGASPDARTIHRYFRDIGEAGIDGALLSLADYLAANQPTPDPQAWGSLLDEVASPLIDAFFRRHQQIVKPPPLLTGYDLMNELAMEPGPRMGEVLEAVLEEQAAGEIGTRSQALDFVRSLV